MLRVLGHDCDGEEIEEFRILRAPFSMEIESWDEEPDVDPRFYCAVVGIDNKPYLISVYDDYNSTYIRKYEKIPEADNIPIRIKDIGKSENYEVAINGITRDAWFYDRDREKIRKTLNKYLSNKINIKNKDDDFER